MSRVRPAYRPGGTALAGKEGVMAQDLAPKELDQMTSNINDLSDAEYNDICPGKGVCRFCGKTVSLDDRICDDCNERMYGVNRPGGEIPAGVDW